MRLANAEEERTNTHKKYNRYFEPEAGYNDEET